MTSKVVRLIDGKSNTGNRFPHNKYQQLILEIIIHIKCHKREAEWHEIIRYLMSYHKFEQLIKLNEEVISIINKKSKIEK